MDPSESAAIKGLAAQVNIMRDWRDVGQPRTYQQVVESMVTGGFDTYVANGSRELRLNGCLGYVQVALGETDGVIRATEGALRDEAMRPRAFSLVVGAMFNAVLTDRAPDAAAPAAPGAPAPPIEERLAGLGFMVASPHTTETGWEVMTGFGLERTAGGFEGDAAVVYAATAAIGLERRPV